MFVSIKYCIHVHVCAMVTGGVCLGVGGCGLAVPNGHFFDTVTVMLSDIASAAEVHRRASEKNIDLYHYEDGVSVSIKVWQ